MYYLQGKLTLDVLTRPSDFNAQLFRQNVNPTEGQIQAAEQQFQSVKGQIQPTNQTSCHGHLKKNGLHQACLRGACCCILASVCWSWPYKPWGDGSMALLIPQAKVCVRAVNVCRHWVALWETSCEYLLTLAVPPASRGAWLQDPLLAQLQRHLFPVSLPPSLRIELLYFFSCQGQLLNFPAVCSKWEEQWQKKLLWFKWVRGQCYSVCLIIYLPSYTQHLLSLEWFKHIITSCFSSFIIAVCCLSSVRNLSWPLQSRGCHLVLLGSDVPPPCFFKFPIYHVEDSENCTGCFWAGQNRL